MRVKSLLAFTALASSILGAIVVYLILTVPNDLKAAELMKTAKADMTAGRNDKARDSLSKIVQQYPRTDAAAAATVALVKISDSEREQLQRELALLRAENQRQSAMLSGLQQSVEQIKNAPPKIVTIQAPPPKKTTVAKRPPAKKKVTPKKSTRRRR